MEDLTKEYVERLAKIEERIISFSKLFEERISALNQRFDDVVASQLKDHGKRIATVENKLSSMEHEQSIKKTESEKRIADLEDAFVAWNKRRLIAAGSFVAGGGALGAIIEWIADKIN